MGFIDDQGVVLTQHRVALNLSEQDAVGHHLDQGAVANLVGEANGVANVAAEW